MHEDNAGDVVVEDVARVAVRLRPAHVEQLCRMERRKGMSLKLCQERETTLCVTPRLMYIREVSNCTERSVVCSFVLRGSGTSMVWGLSLMTSIKEAVSKIYKSLQASIV